ncbi:hypothetical protein HN51_042033 [Arachis hypogaea]|uniref:uncharacterized protein LOC130935950 n=1 Tax=Arachis stenosperma TaxID=217475 RepID=UPI000DEC773F|nr:uncharacterized protein LOC112697534 [Arachis hypogaea]XP_057721874.1 uncharacterized protein LOC130935950 [Arachis stenosperma]QHN87889.1 uncharacterized protein DS421_16g558970 [Arachis hypogaea]
MAIDDWMKLAMADDSVVADLLVKIKHSEGKSLLTLPTPVLPSWGARKRRSKLEAASRAAILAAAAAANSSRKKDEVLDETEEDSTRCSPTTPLSWNGSGASPSSAADGFDDSRSPTHNNTTRSKATATSEYTSNSASNKKCRRRKTFSQLQEEESSLLQEKIYLTKEIANVSASCKAQRARNESLKRMKLDLGSAPDGLPHPNSDQPKWTAITSSAAQGDTDTLPQPQTAESARSVFLVPDLNMMPSEDDSYMDIERGMS